MTLKDQWKTIKNNWLIIIVVLVIAAFLYAGDEFAADILPTARYAGGYAGDYGESVGIMAESVGYASSPMMKSSFYQGADSFAPDVEDRQITKTTSLSTEVTRGTFQESEQRLKGIISSPGAFLLDTNVQKYDVGTKSYYRGTYTVKIDVQKYDEVVAALKQLGEIQSFSENVQDITGIYTNLQTELTAERARLQRYQQMLQEAEITADKLEISDRIFNQERTIKYLEDSLKNQDERVEYATVYVQMTEKRSEFSNVAFVTFGQLVTGLVSSTSNLLKLIFTILPWVVIIAIVWLGVRWVRRRK